MPKYNTYGPTTDSKTLQKSWVEIYQSIILADNAEIERCVKRHVRLTGFAESIEWVERIVGESMMKTTPELKELIDAIENNTPPSFAEHLKKGCLV